MKQVIGRLIVMLALAAGLPRFSLASSTHAWLGSVDGNWFNAGNWESGQPVAGDSVTIGASGSNPAVTSSTPVMASITITNKTVTLANWSTALRASNIIIRNAGIITLPSAFTTNQMSNRVWIVCTNLTINNGGQIDADSKGYSGWYGPGCPGNGGAYFWPGASHGGRGGEGASGVTWAKDPYGSSSAPVQPGSGGGSENARQTITGKGGGAIRIQASGTVTVDGTISARGGNAGDMYCAAGAGGSVYITCKTFGGAATGLIRVDGGNSSAEAQSGGGGGGRIAVSYQSLSATHAARFSAAPASQSWSYGDPTNRWYDMPMPGTLWLPDTQLLSTSLDSSIFAGAVTVVGITNWTPATLTVSGCWVSFGQAGMQLKTTGDITVDSGGSLGIGSPSASSNCAIRCGGSLTVTNGGQLYAFGGRTNATGNNYGVFVGVTSTLAVGPNSWVHPVSHWTNGGSAFFKVGNVVLETNGGFNAAGKGYRGTAGPGSMGYTAVVYLPGASHGGRGGCYPATGNNGWAARTYDSVTQPIMPGSGGAGYGGGHYGNAGHGGGVIRIDVAGTATIRGSLNANGAIPHVEHGSGGAGGSVYLKCNTFAGTSTGAITARGGSGYSGTTSGAGGGGRIAVDYQSIGTPAAVKFAAGPGPIEWANDGSEDRWAYRARWGTLWLPNTALLSGTLKDQRFNQVHIHGISSWGVSSLTVSNCALTFAQNMCRITITNSLLVATNGVFGLGSWSAGTNYFMRCGGNMVLTNGGRFHLYSGMTNSVVTNYGGYLGVTNMLDIESNSWLYTYSHGTNGGTPRIVAGSARIAAGGGIMADTRGYSAAQGPGSRYPFDLRGGGGGHGGHGGSSSTPIVGGVPYGSVDHPITPGSGGTGYSSYSKGAGPGGGCIRLEVATTLTIRGTISANGGSSYTDWGGGGAGGGIYLGCQTLDAKSAVVRANGGNPLAAIYGGPGSGGRIAVNYQTLGANKDIRFTTSPGTIGWAYDDRDNRWRHMPGMGSVSLPDTALLPNPLTDKFADDACLYFTRTGRWSLAGLVVTNCTVSFAEPGFRVKVTNDLIIGANGEFGIGGDPAGTGYVLSCGGNIILTNSGIMTVYSGMTNAATPSWGAEVNVTNDFTVYPGSRVYPASHESNGGSPLFRMSNLYIRAAGRFSANTKGYGPRMGPGAAPNAPGAGGGGHGGKGGAGQSGAGGTAYGVTNAPVRPGSGGGDYPNADRYDGAGAGGGAVRVDASGAIQINGTICANGESGIRDVWGSGGAGGAIYLACNTFYGGTNAVIQANGGSSYGSNTVYTGGGGGGRIAVWQGVSATNRALYLGGEHVENLSISTFFPDYDGTVSCTNGAGRMTSPAQPGTRNFMRIAAPNTFYLNIDGVPSKFHGSPQPFGYGSHLNITNGTVLTNRVASPADQVGGLRHTCTGWKLKTAAGALVTNNSSTQAVFSLTTNMVLTWYWTNQYLLTVSSSSNGSVNSGVVNNWYTNNRVVAGIQASPSNGYAFALWTGDVPPANATDNPLALTMSQARTVQAHFIEAISLTKLWNGNGPWTNAGNWNPVGTPSTLDHAVLQSGTCVLRQNAYVKSLVITNGSTLVFTNWSTKLYVSDDVTIRGGGLMTLPAAFTTSQMSNRVYFSCSNLLVEKNGRIDTDRKGYFSYNGPGRGSLCTYGNGGGYGGQGGREFPDSEVTVGQMYGSPGAPLAPGSGGGSHPSSDWPTKAGSGGGAVRVEASGTVTVHGVISANGGAATNGQHSAGGSGGAIYITCKTFGGSSDGLMSVNGGNGWDNNLSGGGGGGRIAVNYQAVSTQHTVRFSASQPTVEFATADMTNRWMHAARMGTLWFPDRQMLSLPLPSWQFKNVNLIVPGMTSWALDSLTVTNTTLMLSPGTFLLKVTNNLTVGSGGSLYLGAYDIRGTGYTVRCNNLILTNGGRLYIQAGITNGAVTNGALIAVSKQPPA